MSIDLSKKTFFKLHRRLRFLVRDGKPYRLCKRVFRFGIVFIFYETTNLLIFHTPVNKRITYRNRRWYYFFFLCIKLPFPTVSCTMNGVRFDHCNAVTVLIKRNRPVGTNASGVHTFFSLAFRNYSSREREQRKVSSENVSFILRP